MSFESVYNFTMTNFEFFALMLADWFNQGITWLMLVDVSGPLLSVVGMVYGLIRLVTDAVSLFPAHFSTSLTALIVSFFLSIIINFIVTIWRIIPFT